MRGGSEMLPAQNPAAPSRQPQHSALLQLHTPTRSRLQSRRRFFPLHMTCQAANFLSNTSNWGVCHVRVAGRQQLRAGRGRGTAAVGPGRAFLQERCRAEVGLLFLFG